MHPAKCGCPVGSAIPNRAWLVNPMTMRTLGMFVMVVLMIYSMMGAAAAAAEEEVEEEELLMEPNQVCGDAHVGSLRDGGAALRTRVDSCAVTFGMNAPARELLLRHIPVRFDLLNARPKGCVEINMTIDQIRSKVVIRSWEVVVDVDNKTQTQNAHYGYNIMGKIPRIPKATGHIFFPPNVYPPNVRPPPGGFKGQKVHFADHKNGPPSNTVYKLSGIMYNTYRTRPAAPHDDDDDDDDDIAIMFTDLI